MPLALLMGCASPHRAVFPSGPEGESRTVPSGFRVVAKGDYVRVELSTGQTEHGEVTAISSNTLILGRPSNFGYQEVSIPAEQIVSIELDGGDTLGDAALAVFVTILGGLGLLVYSFTHW